MMTLKQVEENIIYIEKDISPFEFSIFGRLIINTSPIRCQFGLNEKIKLEAKVHAMREIKKNLIYFLYEDQRKEIYNVLCDFFNTTDHVEQRDHANKLMRLVQRQIPKYE